MTLGGTGIVQESNRIDQLILVCVPSLTSSATSLIVRLCVRDPTPQPHSAEVLGDRMADGSLASRPRRASAAGGETPLPWSLEAITWDPHNMASMRCAHLSYPSVP